MLPWHSLLTRYKLFVKPQIDYSDIFYDHQSNKGLCQKTVTIQRNAALAKVCPVVQKNCFLTLKKLAYQNIYLIRYHKATIYTTLSQLRMLKIFTAEQDVFTYSYSPYSILEWKKLDMQIRRSESFWFFKNSLLKIG